MEILQTIYSRVSAMIVEPGKTRVGWIGLGVMGRSMCKHIIDRGFSTTVFTRTKEKAKEILQKGAEWRDSPLEVAKNSDVIFSKVAFPSDVREVFLGDDGLLQGCDPGDIIVDMTTSEPSLAREIYQRAKEKRVAAIDAPVSGGDIGARKAHLSIMVGGDTTAVDTIRPCFESMGTTIINQGGPGSGQHTKMVNQILIASGMIGVCEALLYAHKSGLDLDTVMKSVSSGAAGSWSLDNYGPRIINNDFDPGFFVEHFIKDMAIALDEAAQMNLSLPGLALAHQLYNALKAQGGSRNGTQALQFALSRLSALDWERR